MSPESGRESRVTVCEYILLVSNFQRSSGRHRGQRTLVWLHRVGQRVRKWPVGDKRPGRQKTPVLGRIGDPGRVGSHCVSWGMPRGQNGRQRCGPGGVGLCTPRSPFRRAWGHIVPAPRPLGGSWVLTAGESEAHSRCVLLCSDLAG